MCCALPRSPAPHRGWLSRRSAPPACVPVLLFAGGSGGHRSRAPSLEFHHRFFAPVRRWADARGHKLPGGWPTPGCAAYVAVLAGHDRHRALSAAAGAGGPPPPLTFSEGNATLKLGLQRSWWRWTPGATSSGFLASATAAQGYTVLCFVEAGEGRTGMFMHPKHTNDLNYSIRQKSGGSPGQWQFERKISLDFNYSFMGSAGRHLFLCQWGSRSLAAGCFSLDVKTFQLERVFVSNSFRPLGHTYSNFPPSFLSTPTISSGVEEGPEEMLGHGCAASSSAQSSQPSE